MLEISFVFDEEQLLVDVEKLWEGAQQHILPALPEAKKIALERVYKIFVNKQHIITWCTDEKFEKERQMFRNTLRKVWNRTFQLEKKGG